MAMVRAGFVNFNAVTFSKRSDTQSAARRQATRVMTSKEED
jgi:hypothetical protein